MAFEQEGETIAQIVEKHAKATFEPIHSAPVARAIVNNAKTLNIPAPMVIKRFIDRLDGPVGYYGVQNKLARDLHGREYAELPEDEQESIKDVHREMFNPAFPHPYFKAGFDFAQAHNLLVSAYGQSLNRFPQTIKAHMHDFIRALELDLDTSAKHSGFFKEYSDANTKLMIATAGPHRQNQSIPMATARR